MKIDPGDFDELMVTHGDAIRISREHEGGIDLLITDLVTPEMGRPRIRATYLRE